MTTRTHYNAITEMRAVRQAVSGSRGTWEVVTGSDFNGSWTALDYTIATGAKIRLASQDTEAELKVHVFDARGWVRYTLDVSQAPFAVVLATVRAALKEMVA